MRGLTITWTEEGQPTVEMFDGELTALQAAVGGHVEVCPSSDDVTLWINDEGKWLDPRPNRLAMDVWLRYDVHGCMRYGDWIAGPCVVTGGVDSYGETLDISELAAAWVIRVARDAGAVLR
jgi:hypothetical protein